MAKETGKNGPDPYPVEVRGKCFPSVEACAKHFGVKASTVYWHLARGQPDRIGVGSRCPKVSKGRPKPVRIGGLNFASRAEAAKALGYSNHRTLRRAELYHKDALFRRALMLQTKLERLNNDN